MTWSDLTLPAGKFAGQRVEMMSLQNNITLTAANFPKLKGGTDVVLALNDYISFTWSGTDWRRNG